MEYFLEGNDLLRTKPYKKSLKKPHGNGTLHLRNALSKKKQNLPYAMSVICDLGT